MEELTIERIEIPVGDPGAKGLRILHLSDPHLSRRHRRRELDGLIDRINAAVPDFVALTGDLVDTPVGKILPLLLRLRRLRMPVFFVSGNHDQVYGYPALLRVLNRCGILVLEGETTIRTFRGRTILLAGLADRFAPFWGRRRDPDTLVTECREKNLPCIFLAHQPKDYRYAQRAEAALFLCGHTHGGQIWPFHWLVRLEQPFIEGLHRVGKTAVFVSRGVGTWGIHRRYRAPAQLPLLVLV